MKPFTIHTGLVIPMDRSDVDTDQLVPKQFLKRVERTGLGQFLFYDWRFKNDGSVNPDFELNRPEYKDATILLARKNFGCGSSREHAPWALMDYGFRVVIASSFADIFYNNSFKNGLLPVRLLEKEVELLFQKANKEKGYKLTVDLEQREVRDDFGTKISFEIDQFRQNNLLKGLDDIDLTMKKEAEIKAYEAKHGIK
ncbi:MAG: 3-isopropylmalate dehydratase small subunit [Planctomycetaceae bacterium]|jgi:3-isopropylmalate/(R)-2-methylmalate dehydratase small subunit|nr:3-isopropylmalate dehydratase small subunit [Planctomycetaceae bacterium]